MIDVYLINPPGLKPDRNTQLYAPASPPLGLSYLSSSLKPQGLSIKAFDFELKEVNLELLLNSLKADSPSVIGITSLTHNYPAAITLASLIKESKEDAIVIMGGNHATFCYEEILNTGFVDYVVLGEGENSFRKLVCSVLNESSVDDIQGIVYRDGKAIHMSYPEDVVMLDDIPFPDRTIFDLNKYYDPINVISSRGCQAKCIFCSASAFRKGKTRFRSAENFLEEVYSLYNEGFRSFNFMDDNFMLKPSRTEDICKGLVKSAPEIGWTCSARAEFINRSNIKLLAKSGCKGLHFGLESPEKSTQKAINKHLSVEKLENALKLANQYDILTYCSLIIGLPGEDINTINKTIEYAVYLNNKYHSSMIFGLLTPFPGTPIFRDPEKYDIEIISNNFIDYDIYTPVINTKKFEAEQLRAILFDAQKIYLSNISPVTAKKMDILSGILKNFK